MTNNDVSDTNVTLPTFQSRPGLIDLFEKCCDNQDPGTDIGPEGGARIVCGGCQAILRGESRWLDVRHIDHDGSLEWYSNEQHDIVIEVATRVGFETSVTITEDDLRAMLAEVKNA